MKIGPNIVNLCKAAKDSMSPCNRRRKTFQLSLINIGARNSHYFLSFFLQSDVKNKLLYKLFQKNPTMDVAFLYLEHGQKICMKVLSFIKQLSLLGFLCFS